MVEWSDAEERVLEDLDTYTDWLAAACRGKRVYIQSMPSDPVDIDAKIKAADVPWLVAAQMYPSAAVSFAASRELMERYLKDDEIWAYTERTFDSMSEDA